MALDGVLERGKLAGVAGPGASSDGELRFPTRLGRRLGVHKPRRAPARWSRDSRALLGQAGVLAHDINNLLNVVLAANEVLALRLPEGSEGRELAQTSLDAVERAAELLDRLADVSAPAPVTAPRCDSAEAVQAVARQARLAAPRSVSVEACVADAPLACSVDRAELEAALLNLCINSAHAIPRGGAIVITAGESGAYVALSVSDDGAGMSPEVLARATEPYFTTRGGRGGTGLGLASVQAFARKAGGRFALASQEGKGTTATLYLPRL